MFSFFLYHCRQVTKTRKPASELNPTRGIKGEFKWNVGGTWEREKLKLRKGKSPTRRFPVLSGWPPWPHASFWNCQRQTGASPDGPPVEKGFQRPQATLLGAGQSKQRPWEPFCPCHGSRDTQEGRSSRAELLVSPQPSLSHRTTLFLSPAPPLSLCSPLGLCTPFSEALCSLHSDSTSSSSSITPSCTFPLDQFCSTRPHA